MSTTTQAISQPSGRLFSVAYGKATYTLAFGLIAMCLVSLMLTLACEPFASATLLAGQYP